MARFLDSSVFLHAYLKPKRKLTSVEEDTKKRAVEILERIEEGEEVATSVIHLSEALNIVESRLGLGKALELLENALTIENLSILTVTQGNYEQALSLAARYGISPNDGVATLLSMEQHIPEVYSFDKHFDNIPLVRRVTE